MTSRLVSWLLLLAALLATAIVATPSFNATVLGAQATQTAAPNRTPEPIAVAAVAVLSTPRVADLPVESLREAAANPGRAITLPGREARIPRPSPSPEPDGALQAESPSLPMPAPTRSFDGLTSDHNLSVFGTRVMPPSVSGDVGINHYVQGVNTLFRVLTKAGAPTSKSVFKLSTLFGPAGTNACASWDRGNPTVLYDRLADRWLLSQSAWSAVGTPPYHQCVAISQTSDPAGSYFAYDFQLPGNEFPSSPKLGVWPDGYYMTTNQFLNGVTRDGAGVFVFERNKMLVGDASAALIYFNLDLLSHPEDVSGMFPSDFDGLVAPAAGRPNTFAYVAATEFGDPADGLRLFDFHADFVNPKYSTFVERAESTWAAPLLVAPFDVTNPVGRDDIRQPPPATDASALDAVVTASIRRLQYRTTGTVESLVVSHTVGAPASTTLGTYRAAIRYYQLTRTVDGGAFGVFDQGTYAPDDGVSRWVPSAAIDRAGNLAVGFSAASISVYPSIRYAGRLAGDPAGTLPRGEGTIVDGTGVQTATESWWGQYSALTVDPVDECTFWFTSEYYSAASQATSGFGWLTRIGSFKFDECTPQSGTLQGTVSSAPGSGAATVEVSNGFAVLAGPGGTYSRVLAPGTYTVTVSQPGYQSQVFNDVTIVSGATTVLDVALVGKPFLVASSSSIWSESVLADGKIDPGETVTVALGLSNNSIAATSNLVATLLPTGGVLQPSGPVAYGVVAGGAFAWIPFTFRASPAFACGQQLSATLQLYDGASDLGVVTYSFTMGTAGASQNFDAQQVPSLPAGWTAANSVGLSPLWVTTWTTPDAGSGAAFVDDPSTISDKVLVSPSFVVPAIAKLTFRNKYALEGNATTGFDGGVLEISVDGGLFQDVLSAGGFFESGGYTATISSGFQSPLAGRQAWTGTSPGYITTVAVLPPGLAGHSVRFQFRMASDAKDAGLGWWIDTLTFTASSCSAASGEYMENGTFSDGADGSGRWLKWGLPDMSYMSWNVTGGVFQFYRKAGGSQAVAFQQTGVPVPASTPLEATFDIGNSMTARKRISVLMHDSNFTDLSVCTFWLDAGAPLSTYRIRTHTTKVWSNASISFYAATAGNEGGGFYRLDNVSLRFTPANSTTRTECVDPSAPTGGGITSPELVTNGLFAGGTIAPWTVFGSIAWQLSSGVFEFFKLPGAPAGVLLQGTNTTVAADQPMMATFQLGNISSVRQRVTVLVHEGDFSDLAACTFWLPPAMPLSPFAMRSYATTAWTNATVSVYPATAGTSPSNEWVHLDNVSLTKVTASITGTECLEPGSAP